MDRIAIQEEISRIENRIEYLKTDRTKIVSVWAQPNNCTPYNHGPYYRKLETKRLKARLKTLNKKLQKIA
jgi:hypothetical protein